MVRAALAVVLRRLACAFFDVDREHPNSLLITGS